MRASTAWADESFQEHDTTGFYIIAAVIIPASAQESARAQMLRAQARHAPAKLHWVAHDDKERLELAYTVAEIEGLHIVAVGSPVHQRRQERARAYCLHQLVLELHGFGVEQLFMEARQPTLNTRDITTVQHARYTLPRALTSVSIICPARARPCCGSPTSWPAPSAPRSWATLATGRFSATG
ncbi:hypothetical protein ACFYOK_38270 [Microbispora bryophytorum]|uniref:hypothetical protein n=1 Tax=Microbispora bryophytorum TaxID=1460882 RepID=UPI0033E6A444